ncbi:MAG: hypothetical protein V1645_02980 [archaeon]
MMDKKKGVVEAPRPSRPGNVLKTKRVVVKPLAVKPKLSKIKGNMSKVSKYLTFFMLLIFFVAVVYILFRKSDLVSSTWIYAALGIAAGFLIILNIYLIRNHAARIKEFFSKFKLPKKDKKPEEKKVQGAVVDDSKKPAKVGKPHMKPKVMAYAISFIIIVVALVTLNSRGIISFSNPYVLLSLGGLFFIALIIISLRFYKYHRSKSEVDAKLSKENIAVIKKSIVAKSSKYKTDLDRLYELINEKGKITLSDVATGFNVSIEMAQEWARILESHDMITLNYPPFGEVELCKK